MIKYRRLAKIKRAFRRLSWAGSVAKFGSFALGFTLLIYSITLFRLTSSDGLILHPFKIPPQIVKIGLDPDTFGRMVSVRLREIEQSTRSKTQQDSLLLESDVASLPDVKVHGEIGLKAFVEMAKVVAGIHQRTIDGNIVLRAPSEADTIQPSTSRALVSVYVTFGRKYLPSDMKTTTCQADDVDEIVQKTTELTLEMVNPYLLAAYLRNIHEDLRSEKIASLVANNPSEPLKYRAAAFNLWGTTLDRSRDYLEAIQRYESAIALDPSDPKPHNNLGIVYKELGNYSKASREYEIAIEMSPDSAASQFNLGLLRYTLDVARKTSNYQDAIVHFQRATELDHNYVDAYVAWGDALFEQRDFKLAAELYQKAMKIDPDSPVPYYSLGILFYYRGDYASAIPMLRKSIKLDSSSPRAHLALSNALVKVGHPDDAIPEFEAALSHLPRNQQPLVYDFSELRERDVQRAITERARNEAAELQ